MIKWLEFSKDWIIRQRKQLSWANFANAETEIFLLSGKLETEYKLIKSISSSAIMFFVWKLLQDFMFSINHPLRGSSQWWWCSLRYCQRKCQNNCWRTCRQILSRQICSLTISRQLEKWKSMKQKNHCYECCAMLLCQNRKTNFLERIVRCDEKWILCNNSKHSGEEGEAAQYVLNPLTHQLMVIAWWALFSFSHYSFMKPGEQIDAERYDWKGQDLSHNKGSWQISHVMSLLELGCEIASPHPTFQTFSIPTTIVLGF